MQREEKILFHCLNLKKGRKKKKKETQVPRQSLVTSLITTMCVCVAWRRVSIDDATKLLISLLICKIMMGKVVGIIF